MSENSSTDVPRAVIAVAAVLLAATAGICCLLFSEWRSLAAPALGPWAGVLFGHHECTMATVKPTASRIVVGAFSGSIVAFLFAARSSRLFVRAAGAIFFLLALTAWCGTALLSFVNMSS